MNSKRSLNVNIFLRQFHLTHEEVVKLLVDGDSSQLGAERLRSLLKILPEKDELEKLMSYVGDRDRLGNAERFLIGLISFPKLVG